MKKIGRFGVEGQKAAAQRVAGGILAAHFALNDFDIGAIGHFFDRADKIELLVSHHEEKNGAAHSAAKTFKALALGIDREGGCLLVVKRAERFKNAGGAFEMHAVAFNHLDDVDGVLNLLNGFW